MLFSVSILLCNAAVLVVACESCYGPGNPWLHQRLVRRMQPDALNATNKPKSPLPWGQLNFLQTTDTHGWLEGHLKEHNYGADWGDYVSFVQHMRKKAAKLDVDLLLVDTGDLHDGAGLSDATDPNGNLSNIVFENVDYDLLAIGNHELYETDVAYETFSQFSRVYGDKYLTSNVQIRNNDTGDFEYIGSRYRYFTTPKGLRIMAFGVLFDFTGNTNLTKVTKTADLVKEDWFIETVNSTEPIDLFVVIGHNPVRPSASTSTFSTLYETIRKIRPNIPFQALGGHTHVRDFVVYDDMSTGLESGRYCETLGWLAMSGIKSDTFHGKMYPKGVPHPTQEAINVTATAVSSRPPPKSTSGLRYARRYLDWNRLTFAYHAAGSQDKTFDSRKGALLSEEITALRNVLNISALYGCAPQTYCQYCKPPGADGNIYTLMTKALAEVVVNDTRASYPRYIIIHQGNIRFDLVQGPFTVDDSYIVSPFENYFQFVPDVPYEIASQVLPILNAGPAQKKKKKKRSQLSQRDFDFTPLTGDHACLDPPPQSDGYRPLEPRAVTRRQTPAMSPGYTTEDDFGSDGDDTLHAEIPHYEQPNDVQAVVNFPEEGTPELVDLVFLDFVAEEFIIPALQTAGGNYTMDDIINYAPKTLSTNTYLPLYAQRNWQENMPNCPVGQGVE